MHSHTYSGNPLGCAAALAVQKILREDNILENAAEKENAKKRMAVSACVNGLWQAVCHLKNCWKG